MNNSGSGSGSTFNQFSSNKYVDSTKDFLESNSLVAKFAFLILVLLGFILLLRVGVTIIGYIIGPSGSPKLINGMVDAKSLMVIPQDPSSENAKTVSRSVNATDGIEFTWSVWIYIDDMTYNNDQFRCVFYKGNDFASKTSSKDDKHATEFGLNFPNNGPGLYITPNVNNLVVMMNTFNVINEQILITDIPLNKWVNVIIRCQNNVLDVYINGTITKSHHLHGVPKQNYGDIYVAPNGGFSGNISNLWYYNYALGTTAISNLVAKGPNTKSASSNSGSNRNTNYLSLRWYFNA
jgi:Concanavalin A-like lectin/glucanases superfamily